MASKVVDPIEIYRRADAERAIARGVLDGMSEDALAASLGLSVNGVVSVLNKLSRRVVAESGDLARGLAIKQSICLEQLYLSAESMWNETKDPRYATEMRGAMADIRKIWGVDAVQRVSLTATVTNTGVMGGILGGLDERSLGFLEQVLGGCESGAGADGEGVPALEGLREAGSAL